ARIRTGLFFLLSSARSATGSTRAAGQLLVGGYGLQISFCPRIGARAYFRIFARGGDLIGCNFRRGVAPVRTNVSGDVRDFFVGERSAPRGHRAVKLRAFDFQRALRAFE